MSMGRVYCLIFIVYLPYAVYMFCADSAVCGLILLTSFVVSADFVPSREFFGGSLGSLPFM